MNDRFKFRVWDKPTCRMFYDVCIGFLKAGDPPPSDWVCADTPEGQVDYTGNRLKNIEIMSCTGLKDKNGKLIYEGDIVKKTGNKFLSKIVFDNESAAFMYVDECGCHFFYNSTSKKIKILGNIYENPELMVR